MLLPVVSSSQSQWSKSLNLTLSTQLRNSTKRISPRSQKVTVKLPPQDQHQLPLLEIWRIQQESQLKTCHLFRMLQVYKTCKQQLEMQKRMSHLMQMTVLEIRKVSTKVKLAKNPSQWLLTYNPRLQTILVQVRARTMMTCLIKTLNRIETVTLWRD